MSEDPRPTQSWADGYRAGIEAGARQSPSFRAAFPLCESSISEPTEAEVERRAIAAGLASYREAPDFWPTERAIETAIRAALIAARSQP